MFFGTMGLPHVLVRFYTNPDGRAARRTTLVVLALLGVFYLLPPSTARSAACTRPTSRRRPRRHRRAGAARPAVRRAGSASCSPRWSPPARSRRSCPPPRPDRLGRRRAVPGRPAPRAARGRCTRFRLAATLAIAVPFVLSLGAARAVRPTLSLAFAVAASSFCPLLVLAIWWRGLTDRGAPRPLGARSTPSSRRSSVLTVARLAVAPARGDVAHSFRAGTLAPTLTPPGDRGHTVTEPTGGAVRERHHERRTHQVPAVRGPVPRRRAEPRVPRPAQPLPPLHLPDGRAVHGVVPAVIYCAGWRRERMGQEVVGSITVGYVFALLQFVSTFAFAATFTRYADSASTRRRPAQGRGRAARRSTRRAPHPHLGRRSRGRRPQHGSLT